MYARGKSLQAIETAPNISICSVRSGFSRVHRRRKPNDQSLFSSSVRRFRRESEPREDKPSFSFGYSSPAQVRIHRRVRFISKFEKRILVTDFSWSLHQNCLL